MVNYVRTGAQQIVSNIVKKAIGGGKRGSGNLSSAKSLNRSGSSSTVAAGHGNGDSYKVLAFPLDVLSDPSMGNHGHYIQFFINVQDNATIKFGLGGKNKPSAGDNAKSALKQFNMPFKDQTIGSALKDIYNKNIQNNETAPWKEFYEATGMAKSATEASTYFNAASKKEAFRSTRASTTRSKTCINMYMPAQVQTQYTANYQDTSIGALSSQAMNAFNMIMDENFDGFGETVASMSEAGKEMLLQLMTATVGTLGPTFGGIEEVRGMAEGRIIAEKMELAFKGVPKRNFSYVFKMMPRSEAEMEEVHEIVKAFKSNMLPEKVAANSRRLVVPNTFNIQYMYVNKVNQYLHQIGECVLESMNVSYGGDRYKTFTANSKGAPPVETTMTLSFKEFHFLTRSDIEEEGM